MTVSTADNKTQYLGNGVTTIFAYPNTLFNEETLEVYVTDLDGVSVLQQLTTDYTIVIAGDDQSATVTMVTAPAGDGLPGTSETLTLFRRLTLKQLIDYISGGKFPAQTHERGLDIGIMIDQQLQEDVDRSLKAPITDTASIGEVGEATQRAGTLQGYDALGALLSYAITEIGQVLTPIEEAQSLVDGQTTVTFNNVNTQSTGYKVCGPLVDQKPLCIGRDYTITNAVTIELAESYPTGTDCVAIQNAATSSASAAKLKEQLTLSDGQTVVNWATATTAVADYHISGPLVDSRLLIVSIDYTVTGANQITLTETHAAGTTILAVENTITYT